MKRALAGLAVFISGCVDSHVLVNHFYYSDGFMVKGIHGRYEWNETKGIGTLTIGEGFEERTYTDSDHDWKADEVKFQSERWKRGESGSEEVFREGDEDFEVARVRYGLEGIESEWRAMPPDERARKQDYFK
jgi:hypothetical protein